MGCDIHLFFEKKNKEGEWEEIEFDSRLSPCDRYYSLFAFLADVRNYSDFKQTPQFAGRGVPIDSVSEFTSEEDYHSLTYASLYEILRAPWKEAKLDSSYFYMFCSHVLPKLTAWCGSLSEEDEKNIRVIMGFDN